MTATMGSKGPLKRVKKAKRLVSLMRNEDGTVDITWDLTLDCGHVAKFRERSSMPSRPLRAHCPKCVTEDKVKDHG